MSDEKKRLGEESEEGKIYTSGNWSVKAGKEKDFLAAWKEFAGSSVKEQAGSKKAFLLQDLEQPQHFVSFGRWKDEHSVRAWREGARFKDFMEKEKELCEDVQVRTFKLAASFEKD